MTKEVENEIQTPMRYRALLQNDGTSAASADPGVVESALERFQDRTLWIAFGGHFNAGKSTLQNSLLGRDLLPSNDKPETGIACFVCPGDRDQAVAIDREGKRREIECSAAAIASVSSLLDPITGEHKPERARAQAVQATLAGSPVPHGVCWIDTPGINDTGEMDSRARGALNDADIVIWVLNSQQLLSEVEQRFIADYVAEHGTRSIMFVVNLFLRDDSEREWNEYIRESQPAILDKIQRFFRGLQVEGRDDRPLIFTTAARAVRSHPDRFDADGLVPFIRGSALFWEQVWLARSERLASALERQESEKKHEQEARDSAESAVRETNAAQAASFMAVAHKALDRKQYDELIANAAAASDNAPSLSAPHVLRSIGLIFSKRYKFAVYATERASALDPTADAPLFPRGWAHLELGETLDAAKDLGKFLDSPAAIGWQRTLALWLRARCVMDDDPGAACSDLLEASGDTLGLSRVGLNASALLYAIAKFAEEDDQWEVAAEMYREAIIHAAPLESGDLMEGFQYVCKTFSLDEVTEPVVFGLSRDAWNACEGVASGRDAAELFIDKIFTSVDGTTVNADLFYDDPDFFLYMASAYAKRNHPGDSILFLKTLLAAKPDFDIKIAKKDQYIGSNNSEDLKQFLTPTFTFEWKAGTMVNYAKMTNTSAFRITNVVLYIHVTRTTGAVDAPVLFSIGTLEAQGHNVVYEVFKNAGMFGKNITKAEAQMSCSELA